MDGQSRNLHHIALRALYVGGVGSKHPPTHHTYPQQMHTAANISRCIVKPNLTTNLSIWDTVSCFVSLLCYIYTLARQPRMLDRLYHSRNATLCVYGQPTTRFWRLSWAISADPPFSDLDNVVVE